MIYAQYAQYETPHSLSEGLQSQGHQGVKWILYGMIYFSFLLTPEQMKSPNFFCLSQRNFKKRHFLWLIKKNFMNLHIFLFIQWHVGKLILYIDLDVPLVGP